jgi:adenylate cyclase
LQPCSTAPRLTDRALYNRLKHDFRTPLNHIIGYCEMLLEEAADLPEQRFVADLQRVHAVGRRLVDVVNDLFDPVKSAAFKSNPGLVEREIRGPLNHIIDWTGRLKQEVHGRGSDEFTADFEKILAAARELLRLVGEHFSGPEMVLGQTESEPSSSATVFIRRPTVATGPFVAPKGPGVSETPAASILVVDDDEGNREMLARRLVRLGFNVGRAENGRRALEMLRAEKFDLMLLDIQMPELNGYEVLEQLKADASLRNLPVIVLSTSDETEGVARAIELGAEDYLPKPFDAALLQARLGASLEKKRLRDREVSYLRQIQQEKQRSEDLLHIILPRDVATELKGTNTVKPRRFENVGVLFCDIVSFTAYCEKHAPEEIHGHLQSLVEAFENITGEHGLEKIKTIGDAFMATAGLLTPLANPALNCARCGLAMIERAQSMPPHWQIRVGVQVGPVIAGVVGRRKYQYDVWGDTVNTAARLEAAAAPGTIYVTTETWQHLAATCEGSPQGRAEIKGKGELELYQIERLRPS